MAACPDVPGELVTVQPWTMSVHLPTVAARPAVVDLEVRPLQDMPGFRLSQGMEGKSVRLPSAITWSLLEGLCFTRGDGAEVWTGVHRRLPGSWDAALRPPRLRPAGWDGVEVVGGERPVPTKGDMAAAVGPWPRLGYRCGIVGWGDNPPSSGCRGRATFCRR